MKHRHPAFCRADALRSFYSPAGRPRSNLPWGVRITTMLYVLDEDTVVEMAPQIPGQLAVDAGEQEAPPKLRLIHSA